MNTYTNSNIDKFGQIERIQAEAYSVDPALSTLLNQNLILTDTSMARLAHIDQVLNVDSTNIWALTNKPLVLQTLKTLVSNYELFLSQQLTYRVTRLNAAKLINNSITPSFAFETNQKTMNDIVLSNEIANIDEYSLSQITSMQSIAAECYYNGGNATLLARALLPSHYVPYFMTYDGSCTNLPAPIVTSSMEVQKSGLVCYPNPASQVLTIMHADQNIIGMKIVDQVGRSVIHQTDINSNKLDVNIQTLPVGIYLLSAKLVNGEEVHSKCLIQQ